jgi:protein-tyrosine-phosphatase
MDATGTAHRIRTGPDPASAAHRTLDDRASLVGSSTSVARPLVNNPKRRDGGTFEPGVAGAVPDPLAVAFICTGNRVRSAVAAELLRRLGGDAFQVASYGTLDLGAIPALPQAIAAAAKHGVDLSHHLTTPLASTDLAATDLVLGFERFHVAAAVVEAGAVRQRTFTLPELVELLRELESDPEAPFSGVRSHARDLVARAAERRAETGTTARVPEIRDPFGGRRSAYERSVGQVIDQCRELVDRLVPRNVGGA